MLIVRDVICIKKRLLKTCYTKHCCFVKYISSTSKQEDLQIPVIAKPSFDDGFPDVDFNDIASDIENFENWNLVNPNTNPVHNQPTVIDLASVLPHSKICLLPYARISGNVTIHLYEPSDNKWISIVIFWDKYHISNNMCLLLLLIHFDCSTDFFEFVWNMW